MAASGLLWVGQKERRIFYKLKIEVSNIEKNANMSYKQNDGRC